MKYKVEQGYMLGCIKCNEKCALYFMPIAYWILNYTMYDPSYDPKKWEFIFRDNILVVKDDDIDDFMKAIQVDRVDKSEVGEEFNDVIFYSFVDFDDKFYVSCFSDVRLETYLPHSGWRGKFDDPRLYVPLQCIQLLEKVTIKR